MTDPHDAGAQSIAAMSLRDYFAAQALKGLLVIDRAVWADAQYAEAAYRIADAMLVEREKRAEAGT
jgi:hypothetical protein